MRHWLLHPIIFYPLALVVAALLILVSLRPQSWPREPAAVSGEVSDGALALTGEALGAPEPTASHNVFVDRDFFGRARALRIAVQPGQAAPGPEDAGVRLLLSEAARAQLPPGPVAIEVTYNPLPVNAAAGLAVSLQGAGNTVWASAEAPPQSGVLRIALPAAPGAAAIGLRVLAEATNEAFGLEITQIRIAPQGAGAAAN